MYPPLLTEDIKESDENTVLGHNFRLLGLDALIRAPHNPLEHRRVNSLGEGIPRMPRLFLSKIDGHLRTSPRIWTQKREKLLTLVRFT